MPNAAPKTSETITHSFRTLDDLDVAGKTVLLRLDLNMPMEGGEVLDETRLTRQLPTVKELLAKKAKVVMLSHFGRPGGQFVPSMSLAPLVDVLSKRLGQEVKFGVDSVGIAAQDAVAKLQPGDAILLENLRFHEEEEKPTAPFIDALASLGDMYVNDAFSCAHRAHASVVGLAERLPSAAGRLMQDELETLEELFAAPKRPLGAIVGGSKVSTKLEMLEHLIDKVDVLMIGGAMANTFLCAEGHTLGTSRCETELYETARLILRKAGMNGCRILLPRDVVVAREFAGGVASGVSTINHVPEDAMALDVGPETIFEWMNVLKECKTLVWNGPIGAFETSPFDSATVMLARMAAGLTAQGKLKSVAGGGDTVAALSHAGLAEAFSYLSTAGGAFLEWLEGKDLPGVKVLRKVA